MQFILIVFGFVGFFIFGSSSVVLVGGGIGFGLVSREVAEEYRGQVSVRWRF